MVNALDEHEQFCSLLNRKQSACSLVQQDDKCCFAHLRQTSPSPRLFCSRTQK